jgi:hypothetical protein
VAVRSPNPAVGAAPLAALQAREHALQAREQELAEREERVAIRERELIEQRRVLTEQYRLMKLRQAEAVVAPVAPASWPPHGAGEAAVAPGSRPTVAANAPKFATVSRNAATGTWTRIWRGLFGLGKPVLED